MDKVKVKICTGTTCYVMGAADILALQEHLGDLADKVEIEGATCLGLCKHDQHGKAPFVMVDDEEIPEASVSKVLEAIRRHVGK